MLTPQEIESHEARIQTAITRAASRLGEGIDDWTPADELQLREDLAAFDADVARTAREAVDFEEDPMFVFREWMRTMFEFFFKDGPHPGWAVRRILMIARRYYPDLILRMNGTDLGLIWGVTRAAESARINLLFDDLRASGARGSRGGGCKREGTRAVNAERARGNQNRRRKKLPKKV